MLGVFRHDRGVHYVYLGTIGGCIITIRGGCAPPKRLSENTVLMCINEHNVEIGDLHI